MFVSQFTVPLSPFSTVMLATLTRQLYSCISISHQQVSIDCLRWLNNISPWCQCYLLCGGVLKLSYSDTVYHTMHWCFSVVKEVAGLVIQKCTYIYFRAIWLQPPYFHLMRWYVWVMYRCVRVLMFWLLLRGFWGITQEGSFAWPCRPYPEEGSGPMLNMDCYHAVST